jgi:hypothetical protein
VKGTRRTVPRTQASGRLRERQVLSARKRQPEEGRIHGRSMRVGGRRQTLRLLHSAAAWSGKIHGRRYVRRTLRVAERCRRDSAGACGSVRPCHGQAKSCHRAELPERDQGLPAGRGHDLCLALRLTILPPSLPPNGTGRRLGGRSRARAKEPVREAMVEIFPPDWNCPTSVRQRHTGSDLGFCLRVELQTFSLHRKRSSDR